MPRQRHQVLWWIFAAACGVPMGAACMGRQALDPPATSTPATRGALEVTTFSRDIAPIVFAKCASCHHPGEAAPFSLLTYDDVRRRSSQIVDVTRKGFMPPWMPSSGKGDFVGSRRLTEQELETIARWVAEGAQAGDPSQMPAAPVFTEGWQTGTPDLVIESPAYTLSGEGRDVFRNFVVPIKLDGPRWIESIEIRPDNPRVTHHARLGVDSSNESLRRDAEDDEPGYAGMAWGQDPDGQLVIWAPGMVASPGTPGVAWRLYPQTCLVLHTHMQPSGKPEVVKFRIGIHFARSAPKQLPAMLRIGSCNIDIPAGAVHHVVTDQYVLPVDVDVHTIFPHAHSLCRELSVTAELPDGSRQPLIAIDRFDENWHDSYRYVKPVRLPKGTRLITTFAYDNTDENIRNRNHPARRVVYGGNVTDEMADVYLQVTTARADQREALMENYKRYELQAQIIGHGKTLELYPDDTWSQEGLATYYVGLGEPAKAIAILEKRLKTGPKAVFPVTSLGMALLAGGDAAKAEAQLRQAVTMDDRYPLAWFGLGKALAAQQKTEPAEQAYRRAVALAPGMLDASLNLADLLMRKGELQEAAQVCVAVPGDSPDMANIYMKLAEISAKRKLYDESIEYCSKARGLAPYTHPPKVLVAVFCCANGDQERGEKLLREARVESPGHPVAALILGQLAARQQSRWNEARDLFAAAAALPTPDNWPESHRRRFLILLHSSRAQLAQQLQDLEMARDALTQWIRYEPENRKLQQMLDSLPASAGR